MRGVAPGTARHVHVSVHGVSPCSDRSVHVTVHGVSPCSCQISKREWSPTALLFQARRRNVEVHELVIAVRHDVVSA